MKNYHVVNVGAKFTPCAWLNITSGVQLQLKGKPERTKPVGQAYPERIPIPPNLTKEVNGIWAKYVQATLKHQKDVLISFLPEARPRSIILFKTKLAGEFYTQGIVDGVTAAIEWNQRVMNKSLENFANFTSSDQTDTSTQIRLEMRKQDLRDYQAILTETLADLKDRASNFPKERVFQGTSHFPGLRTQIYTSTTQEELSPLTSDLLTSLENELCRGQIPNKISEGLLCLMNEEINRKSTQINQKASNVLFFDSSLALTVDLPLAKTAVFRKIKPLQKTLQLTNMSLTVSVSKQINEFATSKFSSGWNVNLGLTFGNDGLNDILSPPVFDWDNYLVLTKEGVAGRADFTFNKLVDIIIPQKSIIKFTTINKQHLKKNSLQKPKAKNLNQPFASLTKTLSNSKNSNFFTECITENSKESTFFQVVTTPTPTEQLLCVSSNFLDWPGFELVIASFAIFFMKYNSEKRRKQVEGGDFKSSNPFLNQNIYLPSFSNETPDWINQPERWFSYE